jgi:glycosyltransferase involved in cell wall biosynthesis
MISFIIPAYNEEQYLGATLRALDNAARDVREPFEIIVVDDASTDRTAAIAREHQARVVAVGNRQIAATRNAGARAASGDVLFFVDADTLANAAAIRAGLRALRRGVAGGGCLFRFDGRPPLWARLMMPLSMAVGRRLKVLGGCFLFCTREAFDAVGGFPEEFFAAEELAFVQALKRHGRFVIPGPVVVTSGRKLQVLRAWDLIRILWLIARRGPHAFRRREGLEIWYAGR